MNSALRTPSPANLPSMEALRNVLSRLLSAISSWRSLTTLLVFGVAVAMFYSLDWVWLRLLQVKALSLLLTFSGQTVVADGFDLKTGAAWVNITSECTYIDWILCSAPFVWRFGKIIPQNLLRVGVMTLIVSLVNLVRTFIPIIVSANGGSWFWSHDLVDYVLWYPGLAVVIVFWLMALMRQHGQQSKEAHHA